MTKIITIPILLLQFLLCVTEANAQFSSGSSFHIAAGTDVSIDGLLLKPSFANFQLVDKEITVSSEAIPGEPHNSIQRVYTLNEPFSIFGSVGIHYDPSELNENVEADLQIAYYNDDEHYVTTSLGTVDAPGNMVFQSFFGKSLLKITATSANSVLPVKLVTFTAAKEENAAVLQWSTSEEVNSDYFEIQRSLTGKDWQVVGRVESAGESKVLHPYVFRDYNPAPGNNLYRLKMTDNDGSYAYSQIRNVAFEAETAFKVFPNPVASQLQLHTADWSKVQSLAVINKLGITVRELKTAQLKALSKKEIDLQSLPTGTYVVKMTLVDGTFQSTKVFKY